MNNAVFGKTMENMCNYVYVTLLVTQRNGRHGAMISKTKFSQSKRPFGKSDRGWNAKIIKFNKPIYVGACILDISKIRWYEFHHEYVLPLHCEKM